MLPIRRAANTQANTAQGTNNNTNNQTLRQSSLIPPAPAGQMKKEEPSLKNRI